MAQQNFPRIYLYRRLVQAKLYMDKHYAEAMELDAIADEAFFSKFHFIRLFKSIYGKTPYQYLTGVRVENARLLLKSNLPVTQVCYAVGFDSVSSFSRLFKRINQLSPQAYQQNELKRQLEIKAAPLKFIPNCFAEQKGWTAKSQF